MDSSFSHQRNPNMEKALFDWPIVLQDVKAKYRLISRKFSGIKLFVSVRQTNKIVLFPFACCFCFVRAFSFQGHTKIGLTKGHRFDSYRKNSDSFRVSFE